MPSYYPNPWRQAHLSGDTLDLGAPWTIDDHSDVSALLAHCPAHRPTALRSVPELAAKLGVAAFHVKDERSRMGLGSFKALGAAYVIARDAAAAREGDAPWEEALKGHVYVAASAGNHGLSLAAGAALFGAQAVIYLAMSVPESFAQRLREKGAEVRRSGAVYEESMAAAMQAAEAEGMQLLSDSSWPGYTDPPLHVMEGYTQMGAEIAEALSTPPTHLFLQAGVGGMAGAMAAVARRLWSDALCIIVVEPLAAPALLDGIKAGRVVDTTGPVSSMGRLDCKTASLIALQSLARDADLFATLTEDEVATGCALLARHDLATSPSGGAALAAALLNAHANAPLRFAPEDRLLFILSEGVADG